MVTEVAKTVGVKLFNGDCYTIFGFDYYSLSSKQKMLTGLICYHLQSRSNEMTEFSVAPTANQWPSELLFAALPSPTGSHGILVTALPFVLSSWWYATCLNEIWHLKPVEEPALCELAKNQQSHFHRKLFFESVSEWKQNKAET